jgi:hypothetical protein
MGRETEGMEEDVIGRQSAWGEGAARSYNLTRLGY